MMWDCVIVGGGPAGLTGATYLGRFERTVLLVDSGESRLKRVPLTRNTPGFPDGVKGTDLLARMQDQASRYGALFRAGEVTGIEATTAGFRLALGPHALEARTVLLATGAKLGEPTFDLTDEALMRGLIRYCPICDGFEARGKNIVVLGGRKGAIAEALFLRTYSDRVTYAFVTGASASDEEQDRARALDIQLAPQAVTSVTVADDVRLEFANGAAARFDVLYPCFGCAPRSKLAIGAGASCSDEGGVIVDRHQQTDVPGLYAAGDVLQGLDQIASACGQAAIAAVAIHNRLRDRDDAMSAKIT